MHGAGAGGVSGYVAFLATPALLFAVACFGAWLFAASSEPSAQRNRHQRACYSPPHRYLPIHAACYVPIHAACYVLKRGDLMPVGLGYSHRLLTAARSRLAGSPPAPW